MSEWLTTGQMIDKLKVGEVAKLKKDAQVPLKFGPSYKHVTKSDDGNISWCTNEGRVDDAYPVVLYGHTCNWKWMILTKYVTFEEAMQALRSGKTVTYHDEHKEGYTFDLEKHWNLDEVADYTMEDLFKKRWTIVG